MGAGTFKWNWFIADFDKHFAQWKEILPWHLVGSLPEQIAQLQPALGEGYTITDGVAVHATARIEPHVVLKAPVIIGPACFVASHAYLRGGVYLMGNNLVGPGCEIKSSLIFPHTNLAHFNFVGDSILGAGCNFEAGSVIANHFNEREDKTIVVKVAGERINTHTNKFGALVGDGGKVGANAVLSPGTVLEPRTVVARLQLI
ncbi:MAG: hypothetical protein ACOYXA_08730 [Bacteroidota bacterium]